ncbi:MAG: beta-ketoacyl-[acyl-carrier-protein] synthase family protein [Desulfuromonas sp.]|nr:MAG: beta-ketoacyl-[acyl-carrier-protein] synthase family protein [Desulfuromonas sp.]
MTDRGIPVTGLGAICAAGPTLPAALDAMFAGRRAPAPSRRVVTSHAEPYPVFEVPEQFFPAGLPGEEELLRTSRLAIAAVAEALATADWRASDLQGLRVGVCLGTTVGCAMNNEGFYRDYRAGEMPDMAPIRRYLRSNPAASVARHFGFDGPVQTVVNACSSGTDAIGIAGDWLRGGLCDIVIAGGADELCRTTCNGFQALMITDTQPVRPFDRNRHGLNLGEGAGVLLLESPALAASRPGREQARLAGYGSGCDAYHLTAPHPEGRGLRAALDEALSAAGIKEEQIAFVNAHGTGTPDNDRVESRTLFARFPGLPFHSTKGFTGHTLGAAGGLEAAFTVACLQRGEIPPSIGFAEPDPELPAAPAAAVTPVSGDFALSESLAFGGNNGVVIFARGGDA